MKIWSVFSLVIIFHLAVIGLLLIQPGCQSQPAERPDPGMTAPATSEAYTAPQEPAEIDSAFNAGLPSTTTTRTSSSRNLSAPTRPEGGTRSAPDTGVLQPVLEPVQDELSVPPVQSEYTVKPGDTLSGIARREGVSLDSLLAANGLSKSSVIYVGQVLMIPASRPAEADASVEVEHSGREVVVARGDTLSSIAARNGTTVKALKALNGLTSDTIFVGQRLAVPESGSAPVYTPPATSGTRSTSSSSGQSYTVQPGDTPSGIARRFGVSTPELMAANDISDPRKLYVGKTLVIPSSGSSQPVASPPPQTMARPTQPVTTTVDEAPLPEPTEEDPMSVLEALEDEDLPFVEVEAVEDGSQPNN
ncbi:MAG: LysM peptidoglycan-binding domain-containing protein [Puniceicoccaceae bacterium]